MTSSNTGIYSHVIKSTNLPHDFTGKGVLNVLGGVYQSDTALKPPYYGKYCTDCNQTLYSGRPPSTVCGWSEHASSKSKMADGRHFGEIVIPNGLTDIDEIWHDDAYWTPGRRRPSKFPLCKNTKMADDHYVK